MLPLFNLRYPRDFKSTTSPRGTLYEYVWIAFFAHCPAFHFWPRVFSRALGCGERRGAACTQRHKCGSRPGSVARAPGVQSRASWQVIMGSLSAEPEPSMTMEPHTTKMKNRFSRVLCCVYQLVCTYHSSHLAWSPGYLAPRVWSPGHLANSHLGPPRVQQQ